MLNVEDVTRYIIDQHQAGHLSEGYAARLLGVDRLTFRDMNLEHDPEWRMKQIAQKMWGERWEECYRGLQTARDKSDLLDAADYVESRDAGHV